MCIGLGKDTKKLLCFSEAGELLGFDALLGHFEGGHSPLEGCLFPQALIYTPLEVICKEHDRCPVPPDLVKDIRCMKGFHLQLVFQFTDFLLSFIGMLAAWIEGEVDLKLLYSSVGFSLVKVVVIREAVIHLRLLVEGIFGVLTEGVFFHKLAEVAFGGIVVLEVVFTQGQVVKDFGTAQVTPI